MRARASAYRAIDLNDDGSLRSVGIGTTIWTLISPLIALFAGGLVAGNLAASFDQRSGLCTASSPVRSHRSPASSRRSRSSACSPVLSLLVGIGAAVGGGALVARKLRPRKRMNSQEVPVVPPPAEPPANAPHVTT